MKSIFINIAILVASQGYCQNDDTLSVLLVGNSIVTSNSLTFLFKDICRHNNRTVVADSITYPGISLANHIFGKPIVQGGATIRIDNLENGEKSPTEEKIKSRKWDYVLLQARNLNETDFEKAIFAFDTLLDKQEIKKMLLFQNYSTTLWSKKERKRELKNVNKHTKSKLKKMNNKMLRIGDIFDFFNSKHPEIDLYPDNCHPSMEGTVIIAYALFYTVYNKAPDLDFLNGVIPYDTLIHIYNIPKKYLR